MKFLKKDLFNIPNILTYIRLICVPFFAWLVLDSRIPNNVWWALGLFIFASVTDVVDGVIARKCNMVSDIGKVLDPLADKLLQVTALITLTLIGYIDMVFPIIFVVKEAYMVIGASVLIIFARRKVTIQSNIWGKLATVFLAAAVFTSFFHPQMVESKLYLDIFLFCVAAVLTIIAAVQYTYLIIKEFRTNTAKEGSSEALKEVDDTLVESEEIVSPEELNNEVIDVDSSEIEK